MFDSASEGREGIHSEQENRSEKEEYSRSSFYSLKETEVDSLLHFFNKCGYISYEFHTDVHVIIRKLQEWKNSNKELNREDK